MDGLTVLRSILTRVLCDELPCTECKNLLCSGENCPNDVTDWEEKVAFCKTFAEKLKIGPCDLGDLEDVKVEDLFAILEETGRQFTAQKEQEPSVTDEEPDLPFE